MHKKRREKERWYKWFSNGLWSMEDKRAAGPWKAPSPKKMIPEAPGPPPQAPMATAQQPQRMLLLPPARKDPSPDRVRETGPQ